MLIKQLSIFLENKSGRLNEVSQILGSNGINMSAFSVADTSEFGILRLIVSDPELACKVLRENLFSVSLTDVVCLNCPNQPGALALGISIQHHSGQRNGTKPHAARGARLHHSDFCPEH